MHARQSVGISIALCIIFALPASSAEATWASVVAKVFGSTREWDRKANVRVQNDSFKKVVGTDLGAVTLYEGKLWLNIGDTQIEKPDFDHVGGNFFVAYTSDLKLEDGIEIEGFLNCNDAPGVAVEPRPSYPIPNAMFTIKWQGKEYMFAQYMEVQEVSGHDHHAFKSLIAKYEPSKKIFVPYKPDIYVWTMDGAPDKHYHFGMASFWADAQTGHLYMVGSPSGRFGGVKLGRISLKSFLDPGDKREWEYYLGAQKWSAPTSDAKVLDSALWLIPPKDKDWNPAKNYDNLKWAEQLQLMTIAEFSIVYNPYLESFLLITGRPAPSSSGGGVWYYTAPRITGPWSKEKMLMANSKRGGFEWTYYGTYTTDAFLRDNGKRMFLVATTWDTYGIYLYEIGFAAD